MNPEIRLAIDEVLQSTAQWKDSTTELCCFYPMRGARADGRLMLVGRALYGSGTEPFKASEMKSESMRTKIIKNTYQLSTWEQGCPIQYLHDGWLAARQNGGSGYNIKKSMFWSVTQEVIKEFSKPEEIENWASYLYWTNLYKVSRKTTGNPSGSLMNAMQQASLKLLATEIELLQPQRILFLTGEGWAEPFFKSPDFAPQDDVIYPHNRVHKTGFWLMKSGRKAAVVTADHPERKKRVEIVADILDAFERLRVASGI